MSALAQNEVASEQLQRAIAFREMHAGEQALLLVNVWSPAVARVAVAAGAGAIGTTSFGIALTHGVTDGEVLAFDDVVALANDIVAAVEVPVTVDLEAGRGSTPGAVGDSMAAVVAA